MYVFSLLDTREWLTHRLTERLRQDLVMVEQEFLHKQKTIGYYQDFYELLAE